MYHFSHFVNLLFSSRAGGARCGEGKLRAHSQTLEQTMPSRSDSTSDGSADDNSNCSDVDGLALYE